MKNDNADSAQTDHLVLDSLESLQEGFLPVFRLIHHIVDVPPCASFFLDLAIILQNKLTQIQKRLGANGTALLCK